MNPMIFVSLIILDWAGSACCACGDALAGPATRDVVCNVIRPGNLAFQARITYPRAQAEKHSTTLDGLFKVGVRRGVQDPAMFHENKVLVDVEPSLGSSITFVNQEDGRYLRQSNGFDGGSAVLLSPGQTSAQFVFYLDEDHTLRYRVFCELKADGPANNQIAGVEAFQAFPVFEVTGTPQRDVASGRGNGVAPGGATRVTFGSGAAQPVAPVSAASVR